MRLHVDIAGFCKGHPLGLKPAGLFGPMRRRTPLGIYDPMARHVGIEAETAENPTDLPRTGRLPGKGGYVAVSQDHTFGDSPDYLLDISEQFHNKIPGNSAVRKRAE